MLLRCTKHIVLSKEDKERIRILIHRCNKHIYL